MKNAIAGAVAGAIVNQWFKTMKYDDKELWQIHYDKNKTRLMRLPETTLSSLHEVITS